MIIGIVIIMVEIERCPGPVKAQTMHPARHKRIIRIGMVPQLVGIHVPLADIGRVVAAPRQRMPQAILIRIKLQFVNHHAVAGRIFAGHQRGPERRTHRCIGHGIPKIDALLSKLIQVRCNRVFRTGIVGPIPVPGILAVIQAKLVGQYHQQIGLLLGTAGIQRRRHLRQGQSCGPDAALLHKASSIHRHRSLLCYFIIPVINENPDIPGPADCILSIPGQNKRNLPD